MTKTELTNMSIQEQQDAFTSRCSTDIHFATQAVAAVLSIDETKAAFLAGVASAAPSVDIPGGLQLISPTTMTYHLGSIQQRLNFPGLSGHGEAPTGQLNLLSYNGSEWNGLLPQAANIVRYLPMGALVSVLVQVLIGTKVGPALLLVLLLL